MGSRRCFTREFKQTVIHQLGTRSIAEICREYDIHQNIVNRWKREYESDPEKAFVGHGKLWKDDALIAQCERVIGRQALQIELLKKNVERLSLLRAEERRMRRSSP